MLERSKFVREIESFERCDWLKHVYVSSCDRLLIDLRCFRWQILCYFAESMLIIGA